jgi:hypothetical protein
VYCSVEDLARYDAALYTDQLVRQTTLADAFEPGRLVDGKLVDYGFAWGSPTGTATTTKGIQELGGLPLLHSPLPEPTLLDLLPAKSDRHQAARRRHEGLRSVPARPQWGNRGKRSETSLCSSEALLAQRDTSRDHLPLYGISSLWPFTIISNNSIA